MSTEHLLAPGKMLQILFRLYERMMIVARKQYFDCLKRGSCVGEYYSTLWYLRYDNLSWTAFGCTQFMFSSIGFDYIIICWVVGEVLCIVKWLIVQMLTFKITSNVRKDLVFCSSSVFSAGFGFWLLMFSSRFSALAFIFMVYKALLLIFKIDRPIASMGKVLRYS